MRVAIGNKQNNKQNPKGKQRTAVKEASWEGPSLTLNKDCMQMRKAGHGGGVLHGGEQTNWVSKAKLDVLQRHIQIALYGLSEFRYIYACTYVYAITV